MIKHLQIYFLALMLSSCAISGKMVSEKETISASEIAEKTDVEQRFYIIGNLSEESASQNGSLNALKNRIDQDSTVEQHLLLMGDNLKAEAKKQKKIKSQIDAQLNYLDTSKTNIHYITGNREWNFDGVAGLEVIEDYLEDKLKVDDILKPNNGCPLESIDLTEDIQLLVIDSQWYIENWYLHPSMNDKCEIKSREKLLEEIEGEIKKNANKLILVAMHHPMYTNGVYGGRFSFRDHIFPLQGNIPLPFVGTLVAQIRSQGGISIQDRFNKSYNELMHKLQLLLDIPDRRILIVSGHEENLQYIEQGNIKQLISGAGSNTKPVTVSDNGIFSYGSEGFTSLEVLKDKSVWANFYASEDSGKSKLIFQKQIFPPLEKIVFDSLPEKYPATYTSSVYELKDVEKSDYFKSFWGNHYRSVYGTKVEAKTALLDTLYGGLEVVRPGGGHQTRSLRLVTKDGKEYNMRALKKSAVQFLETTTFKGIDGEQYFSNTVPEDLILDFYTSAHPYGAFAIPELAKAAKVFYTTPQLFFVPKQKRLGKYSDAYGNELYMIVERPTEDFDNRKSFGYPDDVESTDDLLQKLREDEDYTLDEGAYIRARLFDMLIGDWDRHSDQWRWAEFEDDNGDKKFIPIPRDRDQVFTNFDGSFLNLLRSLMGAVNQFGVYGEEINDIRWFNEAGSRLDRALIKRSDRNEWLEQAQFIQKNITQESIDKAFRALPIEVQDSTMQEIKQNLMLRKDNLANIANAYFDEFLKFQMLTGTDKDDWFVVERKPKGETKISAFRKKDGKKGDILFERTFNRKQTKEIWLYALDDDDYIEVVGKPEDPIRMRIIGGQDEDVYSIEKGRNIFVYDHRAQKTEIEKKGGTSFKFTKFYEANLYDYKKVKSTSGGISAYAGYNEEYGTVLQATYKKDKNIFITNPYSRRTEISANYHFLTQGLDVSLLKGFASIFSDFNFVVDGRYTSRNYTENFFGFGNETVNEDDARGLNYNRTNLGIYQGGLGIERESKYGSYFQVKYDISSVEVIKNGANFISTEIPQDIEGRDYFGIAKATYIYQNFDDKHFPSKGLLFDINGGTIDNFANSDLTLFADAGFTFYNSLLSNNRLVLKTKGNYRTTFRDQPKFYQQASLGANNGLRGYRNERFTGNSSILGSAELAYSFRPIKTAFLPLGLHLYSGFDIGRVFQENEDSQKWHNSYGGGLLLTWTEALTANFNVFNSSEDTRLSFGLKFSF